MPGIFFFAGQISDGKRDDQRPMKQPNQNIPDLNSSLMIH
jgi:hypothetical protein